MSRTFAWHHKGKENCLAGEEGREGKIAPRSPRFIVFAAPNLNMNGEEEEFLELPLLYCRCERGGRAQGGKLFVHLHICQIFFCCVSLCEVEMINKLNVSFLSFQMTLKDEREGDFCDFT